MCKKKKTNLFYYYVYIFFFLTNLSLTLEHYWTSVVSFIKSELFAVIEACLGFKSSPLHVQLILCFKATHPHMHVMRLARRS